MGFNFVKERIMRRNYGVIYTRIPFLPGDPRHLLTITESGMPGCKKVMRWYALKGEKVADGHVVTDSFTATYSPEEYEEEPILSFNALLVCEDDPAPKYDNDSVVILCVLPADLTPLKPFEKHSGAKGIYYEVTFDLSMSFGQELEFKLLHNDKVISSICARYS
jgi:hypothetical protein